MLKIRLTRLGRKKRPFYRIVAADSRSPRDGKFLEILGTYDPIKEPAEISFNKNIFIHIYIIRNVGFNYWE